MDSRVRLIESARGCAGVFEKSTTGRDLHLDLFNCSWNPTTYWKESGEVGLYTRRTPWDRARSLKGPR